MFNRGKASLMIPSGCPIIGIVFLIGITFNNPILFKNSLILIDNGKINALIKILLIELSTRPSLSVIGHSIIL